MKINDQVISASVPPVVRSGLRRAVLSATLAALGIAAASGQMTPPIQPAPAPAVPAAPAMPAAQSANPNEAVFKRIDTDGDGYISKVELQKADANLAKDFEKFDADKDGRLSMTEFDAMMKAMRG